MTTPISETNKGIVYVPVSIGELWDKYTILLIKQEKICDSSKRAYIEYELGQLQLSMNKYLDFQCHPDFLELRHTNESLWEIEDALRVKEMNGDFDLAFIDLARQVYHVNDTRASIKKRNKY